MAAAARAVAGVEGGATRSVAVVVGADGAVVAQAEGPGSNPFLTGVDAAATVLVALLRTATAKAGITAPLAAVGLALSGLENEEIKAELDAALHRHDATLAQKYAFCNDVLGSVSTASALGGVCLIAGTGSNCIVLNPDGMQRQAGGWGHVLGDQGGAYDTAMRAVRLTFCVEDGLVWPDTPVPDVTYVRAQIMDLFNLTHLQKDLLDLAYTHFNKSKLAGLTARLAHGADLGDPFCRQLLDETGRWLGLHVRALLPHTDKALLSQPGGLTIVCVGSVFKAFPHLRAGLSSLLPPSVLPNGFQLVRLTCSAAVGAAAYAARHILHDELPLRYSDNIRCFYRSSTGETLPVDP